jgi:hypothetical protein
MSANRAKRAEWRFIEDPRVNERWRPIPPVDVSLAARWLRCNTNMAASMDPHVPSLNPLRRGER